MTVHFTPRFKAVLTVSKGYHFWDMYLDGEWLGSMSKLKYVRQYGETCQNELH